LLGVVQGITEFLPISSSGHLALLEHYLHVSHGGLGFDVLLHMGSLLALVLYFYQDWLGMAHSVLCPSRYNRSERRLLFFMIIATIPGGIAGVVLEKKAETVFRGPGHIAVLLALVGLLLILGEILARHQRSLERIGFKDAVLIGLSQAFAIMPGTSRSGITMTTGLFLGFDRRAAAHFSFLLATPIIAGAGLYQIPKWLHEPVGTLPFFPALLGFLGAMISSYLAIKFLMGFLQRHTFIPFAVYRLLLAAMVLSFVFLH
ncbi:MAG TPA: undecaprenyl-diphosphatase UppP, partial [Desulfobaccales bacterium]|nr:undecaprenyl-diphosphatase UppP [Desulfobaccales bacterium]